MADQTSRTAALTSCLLAVAAWAGPAAAQDTGPPLELPPAPGEQAPILVGEVHAQSVFPIVDGPLCPADATCIFRAGGGVGARIERLLPTGLSLGILYDGWFLDGGGVYEIGVAHLLHFGARYQFLRERLLHPFVGASLGGLIFGDSFGADAIGGAAQLQGGVEIELTAHLALSLAMSWWVLTTTSFTTVQDGVERGRGAGLSVATALQLGLAIFQGP